jgi:hypothetical protein
MNNKKIKLSEHEYDDIKLKIKKNGTNLKIR